MGMFAMMLPMPRISCIDPGKPTSVIAEIDND
jgi:hypothetical protein